jgi:phospholipase/carboxylesterase
MLLRHPTLLSAAVLLAAMVPFAAPPDSDLVGTLVIISNGDRDPMITVEVTQRLARQLRERGAEVVELPHPGGHQIDPAVLPQISQLICRPERPIRFRPV